QLYAYFNNVPESGGVDRNGSANPVLELPTPEQTGRIAELQRTVDDVTARLSKLDAKAPERANTQKNLDEAKKSLEDARNSITLAMVMEEMPKPREAHVLIRGA